MRRARGFTLVEVLVALAIVALGMAALLETLSSSADTTTWLRDRTFAQWIGFNQLTLLRLSGQPPATGQTDGELDFGGRHWRWRQEVSAMDFPGVMRIDVKVQPADTPLDDQHWMATVTGAMGDAVSPSQLQSLYQGPGQSSSAPSSQPTQASAPGAAQTPLLVNPSQASDDLLSSSPTADSSPQDGN